MYPLLELKSVQFVNAYKNRENLFTEVKSDGKFLEFGTLRSKKDCGPISVPDSLRSDGAAKR